MGWLVVCFVSSFWYGRQSCAAWCAPTTWKSSSKFRSGKCFSSSREVLWIFSWISSWLSAWKSHHRTNCLVEMHLHRNHHLALRLVRFCPLSLLRMVNRWPSLLLCCPLHVLATFALQTLQSAANQWPTQRVMIIHSLLSHHGQLCAAPNHLLLEIQCHSSRNCKQTRSGHF